MKPLSILLSVGAICVVGYVAYSISAGSTSSDAKSNVIEIDGSSTVFLISQRVAEKFKADHPEIRTTVAISGTGGGFKKFCAGTTVINDASRPIKPSEAELAAKNKVEYIELPVAYDGLSVVVNKDNSFVDHLTVAELKKIWERDSKVTNWKQVRDGFPDLPMKLYGPDHDSGTFDYFTEEINGKGGACRKDYTPSTDDNILVMGVAGDKGSLGYFGFAYYVENKDRLKIVPIQGEGGKPVVPSLQSINDGSYKPLSRPIFIYVARSGADSPTVKTFVEFYLEHAPVLAEKVGYVKLPDSVYASAKTRFANKVTGSVFASPDARHKKLTELFH